GVCAKMMVVGKGRDDGGAQLVGLRVGQFQRRHFLQMIMKEPGVIDQALQDQRLAARESAALATHDRACRKLRARRLIGPAGEARTAGYPLPAAAGGLKSAAGTRVARGKTPG